MHNRFILILLLSILNYTLISGQTQPKDIKTLDSLYHKNLITEKQYLDSIYSTMRNFFFTDTYLTNRELLELLSTYRKTIWKTENEDHKRNYYALLSNEGQKNERLGEMRYYAEKINEVEQKKNREPSITAMTIIADYYNTLWSYTNTRELYLTEQAFVNAIPSKAAQGKLTITQMVQAGNMLEKFATALFELKDSINGDNVVALIQDIKDIATSNYKDLHYELAHLEFVLLHSLCIKGKGLESEQIMKQALLRLEQFRQQEQTPDNLKSLSEFVITDNKIILFLHEKNTDSARHYIQILEAEINSGPSLYSRYMLQKYKSRLLYTQGMYKASADTLISAMLIAEDIRKDIVKDVNEMMYAQAKADEQQILLKEAASLQQTTKTQLIAAGIGLLSILAGSFFTLIIYRHKQRNKFLNFKLNLARSIHDEANPALLYAKALIKNGKRDNTEKSELEKHIEHTMELIRSLSHDLKSDKQYTLSDLSNHIHKTLTKISEAELCTFDIKDDFDKKRFISHYQYTQIKAILNECIANSIKHAVFDKIEIIISQHKNDLHIKYRDNGTGWNPEGASVGIGMQNMKERIHQLNGSHQVNNHYPNSYHISFFIPLK